MIKINNITKVYKLYKKPFDRLIEALYPFNKKFHKEFFALENITFEINAGETVGIIGKNGSGKSTLLKIITGVLTPTAGQMEIEGKISALLELGAGFNPDYSGIENIYFHGTMLGISKSQMDLKLKEILEFADIGDFIYQPVKTYSSGMFVRLAFAVSINVDPDILIVDEALSVGDVFFQAKCYKKFEEFKKMGKTILFVTHDMSSIMKYCDRAIVLNEGKIVDSGKPGEMIDIYKKILVNLHKININNEPNLIEHAKKDISGEWKKSLVLNPDLDEYGNFRAQIVDFAVMDHNKDITNAIMKGRQFSLKLRIKFNDRISNPIFAFTIKDLKGTDLTGTNTMLESVLTGDFLENQIVDVTFEQENTLQGGDYLISFGCTGFESSEFVVYHRLYDIVNIHVISNKNSVGYFDLNSEIILE